MLYGKKAVVNACKRNKAGITLMEIVVSMALFAILGLMIANAIMTASSINSSTSGRTNVGMADADAIEKYKSGDTPAANNYTNPTSSPSTFKLKINGVEHGVDGKMNTATVSNKVKNNKLRHDESVTYYEFVPN